MSDATAIPLRKTRAVWLVLLAAAAIFALTMGTVSYTHLTLPTILRV